MADVPIVLEIQNTTALKTEEDISGGAQKDKPQSQAPLVMTEEDDSVFYSEEEEIPQQVLGSIWAPHSSPQPTWLEKPNSAPHIHKSGAQTSCHSTGLMEASSEHNNGAMLKEMESEKENKVNNASSIDTDPVHGEVAANSRITQTDQLSVAPLEQRSVSIPNEAAENKEREHSISFLPDEAGKTEVPGETSLNLEEQESEHGLDVACESDNEAFNHLKHAKYGTVSYRKIQRGQTRKRIEMFESMMQL